MKRKGGNWDPTAPQLKPHQFKPGQSGNPGGRPKNPAKGLLTKVTLQQYRRIIRLLVKGNLDELERVVKDPKSSALEAAIAACIGKAIEKGDAATIELFLSRVVGKIPEEIKVTGRSINTNINAEASKSQVKRLIAEVEEEV